ncbi:MAG: tRNA uracil 4-sulfurtransferase ThiI [Johnsonella sp.]|nr:tRNA uracil 4-sulfurtransferase ThiI [Johnsonella sp.]
MKFKTFLIKYGEIGVKGKNRSKFEDALMKQIRIALKPIGGEFSVSRELGRVYVDANGAYDEEEVLETLSRVFGIVAVCPMVRIEDKDLESLKAAVISYMDRTYPDKKISFKVDTRRADKSYPISSEQLNALLGEAILEAFEGIRVDVHKPDVLLKIEIRNHINIYSASTPGPGGMPVGTNGRAMLLLSGGIDSPVAGYMIAKRGVKIEAVYFHAPPYTSERAKQKVIDLARIVARYAGTINLHIINFTDIQLYIYENCPHDELTIIMRRYMMRISQSIAKEKGDLALITGESIGQVASQTIQSLVTTNEVCDMPVFRPLVGLDKSEIVELAQKIGTYETSIEPYEDCCTIFVAKHPVTKPLLEVIKKSEENLKEKIELLVEEAIEKKERVLCAPKY